MSEGHTVHAQCLYSFSYPGACVLKCPPHSFPTRESNSTATSFLSDAFQRLPSICGCRLSFATKHFAPKSQLQYASLLGSLKQVQMPLEPITFSSAGGSSIKDTSYALAGAKRKATSLMSSSNQMVPGKPNDGSGSSSASTQCTRNVEKAAQPNTPVYVPKFGSAMIKTHTTHPPTSASDTVQPAAKKPAHKPNAHYSTPTIQKPSQIPAREPPQAPTVPHQRVSVAPNHILVPMRDQLQPTPTAPHRPNNASQKHTAAAAGGAAIASKSVATHNTHSNSPDPFRQVPTSILSRMEDDDAFYPAMHSKRVR